MTDTKMTFGQTKDGRQAHLVTLTNKNGMSASITDFGATLVKLFAPDKNGKLADVVWGFDDVSGYENTTYYMGATIGRHAGQVEEGTFSLNGKTYNLVINDHNHTMHGGPDGFHSRLFDIAELSESAAVFKYLSPDGEANFPGNLHVTVTYRLTDENELHIDFDAHSDADTVLSMTNHSYFNFDGVGSESILNHQLKIYGSQYTEVDEKGLPTGKICPVDGTPYDFMAFHTIGERINDPSAMELKYCSGYDHNWIIDGDGSGLTLNCEVINSDGTRHLQLFSNQPGLQMYSGNYLNGTEKGKDGTAYQSQSALCLEPQVFPNGLNHSHFPSPVLTKGQEYCYRSVYKFL